jgi:hypothetical protein
MDDWVHRFDKGGWLISPSFVRKLGRVEEELAAPLQDSSSPFVGRDSILGRTVRIKGTLRGVALRDYNS